VRRESLDPREEERRLRRERKRLRKEERRLHREANPEAFAKVRRRTGGGGKGASEGSWGLLTHAAYPHK